jgi:hypothetical protein
MWNDPPMAHGALEVAATIRDSFIVSLLLLSFFSVAAAQPPKMIHFCCLQSEPPGHLFGPGQRMRVLDEMN